MKKILIAAVLALAFTTVAAAQQIPPAPSFDQVIAARDSLIRTYILDKQHHYLASVSVCGEEDVLNGRTYTWLCVRVYHASIMAFAKDLLPKATKPLHDGPWYYMGVPMIFTEIK